MGFTPDLTDHLWDKRSPLSPGLFSLAEPNTPEGTGRGWLPAGVGVGGGVRAATMAFGVCPPPFPSCTAFCFDLNKSLDGRSSPGKIFPK